jgi:hypothetical protein
MNIGYQDTRHKYIRYPVYGQDLVMDEKRVRPLLTDRGIGRGANAVSATATILTLIILHLVVSIVIRGYCTQKNL